MTAEEETTEELMARLTRLAEEANAAAERQRERDEQVRRRVVEAVSGSDPGRWFVLFCRACDPDLETPMPFLSAEDRGRWAGWHTREAGHARWYVIEHDVGDG